MIGFLSTAALSDVSARQCLIGGALKRQFDVIARQSVPDQMIDLLRRADARWLARAGREFQFTDSSMSVTSLTVAMAIVGTLIVLLAGYDVAAWVASEPKTIVAAAFFAALAATIVGAAWLIEDK